MGGIWNLLTFDELRRLTDEELMRMINDRLHPHPVRPFFAQPADFLAAQFYVAELHRRENERANAQRERIERNRWWLDFFLEALIVVLIGFEIWLALSGMHHQSQQSSAQLKALDGMQTVLANLEKTSEATAAAMVAEEKTSQHMNAVLQKQVELFYDVQLNVVYNGATKELVIINSGRSNVALWAQRITALSPRRLIYPKADVIPPSGSYETNMQPAVNSLTSAIPKGQTRVYGYTYWVKNERNEKFTVSGMLVAMWKANAISFNLPINTITPGWNKN